MTARCRGRHPPDSGAYCKPMFLEQVSAIIREVAMAEVVPRFRALDEDDVKVIFTVGAGAQTSKDDEDIEDAVFESC